LCNSVRLKPNTLEQLKFDQEVAEGCSTVQTLLPIAGQIIGVSQLRGFAGAHFYSAPLTLAYILSSSSIIQSAIAVNLRSANLPVLFRQRGSERML